MQSIAKPVITVDDLTPGREFDAPHQGTGITPRTFKVKVVWVGCNTVWYTRAGGIVTGSTTIARFLSILNQ